MAVQDFHVGSFTNAILRYSNEDGEDSEIKCHEAILSWRSEDFKAMLENGNYLQMNGHSVLQLDKDIAYDESDVQAALRYMYTGKYESGHGDSWWRHLQRARFAKQYGLPEMEQEAIAALADALINGDLYHVASMLNNWDQHDYKSDMLEETVRQVRERHADELANYPHLARRSGDKRIMETCLGRIFKDGGLRMRCANCAVRGKVQIDGPERCEKTRTKDHTWIFQM